MSNKIHLTEINLSLHPRALRGLQKRAKQKRMTLNAYILSRIAIALHFEQKMDKGELLTKMTDGSLGIVVLSNHL